jgi:hypothetical protein
VALEISITASLYAFKAAVMAQAVGRSVTNFQFNMSGVNYVQDVITVNTSLTRIPLGQCTQPHWAYFRNLDPTNQIDICRNYSPGDYNVIQMFPNEPAFLPLVSNLTEPNTQATVNATGGGSTGGSLGAGTYQVYYTLLNAAGLESTVGQSLSTTFTVATGNQPQVTFPALPTGIASYNLYCTDTTQANPRLYATGITGTTYTMSAALPTFNTTNRPPPILNQLGFFALAGTAPCLLEYLILSR